MKYALKYCTDSGRSTNIPIVRINEGNEPEEFLSAFYSKTGDDDAKIDYGDENIKRHWDLQMNFDAKNRIIVLRVTDKVTKQIFGKDICKTDVGKDIVTAYKEIINDVNGGNVKYTFSHGPPLVVDIGNYNFSCPGY
eukprot:UN03504